MKTINTTIGHIQKEIRLFKNSTLKDENKLIDEIYELCKYHKAMAPQIKQIKEIDDMIREYNL